MQAAEANERVNAILEELDKLTGEPAQEARERILDLAGPMRQTIWQKINF